MNLRGTGRVSLVAVLVVSLITLVCVDRASATPIPIGPTENDDCELVGCLAAGIVLGVGVGGVYVIGGLLGWWCDPPISGSFDATGTSPGSESYSLILPPQADGLSNAVFQDSFQAGTSGFANTLETHLQRFTGSVHGQCQSRIQVDYTTPTAASAIPVAVNFGGMNFGIKKNVGADEIGWHNAQFHISLETSQGATYDVFQGAFDYNANGTGRTWTATGDWSNSDWTQVNAMHNGHDFVDVTYGGQTIEALVPAGLNAGETYTIVYEIVYDCGSAPEPHTLCLLALGGLAVMRRGPALRRSRPA